MRNWMWTWYVCCYFLFLFYYLSSPKLFPFYYHRAILDNKLCFLLLTFFWYSDIIVLFRVLLVLFCLCFVYQKIRTGISMQNEVRIISRCCWRKRNNSINYYNTERILQPDCHCYLLTQTVKLGSFLFINISSLSPYFRWLKSVYESLETDGQKISIKKQWFPEDNVFDKILWTYFHTQSIHFLVDLSFMLKGLLYFGYVHRCKTSDSWQVSLYQ